MTGLGFLQVPALDYESLATGASDDGLTVAGTSMVSDPNDPTVSVPEAFVWESGVMTGLGFLAFDGNDFGSEAFGISGDGRVVVGRAMNTDPNDASKSVREAFIWKNGVMTGLGFLETSTVKVESQATVTSYDGTWVVGHSNVTDPNKPTKSVPQAFRWSAEGGMEPLGFLSTDASGGTSSRATGVSEDGSIVVGRSMAGPGNRAFIWTAESNEMRTLHDMLEEELGVDLTGWVFDKPPLITPDGGPSWAWP